MVDKTNVHFYPIIRHYPPLSTINCVDTVFGANMSESFQEIRSSIGSRGITFVEDED
jgi:hypothetical protein